MFDATGRRTGRCAINGVWDRLFGEVLRSKKAVQWVKSVVQLVKSVTDLTNSPADLTMSVIQLICSITDLTNSVTDLTQWTTDFRRTVDSQRMEAGHNGTPKPVAGLQQEICTIYICNQFSGGARTESRVAAVPLYAEQEPTEETEPGLVNCCSVEPLARFPDDGQDRRGAPTLHLKQFRLSLSQLHPGLDFLWV